ncbi:MAG: two-component regulator propeller domain-containing protein, partial [Pseudomonadota bacterium]
MASQAIVAVRVTLLSLLLLSGAAARDNVVFSRITTADGLSQESVNVITQDDAGFIWIGTQEGLNRFDGRQTRVYLHDPADPTSIPNDWINDILITQRGDLWVATQRGLARFFGASQQFQLIETPDSEVDLTGLSITVLHQDGDGHIWVGTEGNGLVVLDQDGQAIAMLDPTVTGDDSLLGNGINDIVSHPDGGVWVATVSGGISLWRESLDEPGMFLRRLDTGDRIISDQVATLLPAKDGRLWLGTVDAGIAVLSPENGSIIRLSHDAEDYFTLSSNRVTALTQDAGGRIWAGTDKGLNLWDPERRGFHRYESDPGSLRSLSDNRITALNQDQGGVLWVGTYSGASTANARIGSVEHFRNRPGEPGSLSSNVVTSFALAASGDLFVGTFGGGLNHLPAGAQEFTVYRDGNGPGKLTDNRVMTLAMDRQDRLLLGTRGSGLFRFEPTSREFTHFQTDAADPTSISFNAVTGLLTDSQGTTWITTFGGGVNRLRDDDRFERFNEAGGHLGSDRVITAVENPRNGEIWFGTHDAGIYVFNPRFNSWRPLDANRGLPSELIVSITFSMNDAWIGTRDRGLLRLNLNELPTRGLNSREYGRASGLPSNAVMGLITDNNNQVWVASNKGLSVIAPDRGVSQTFNVTHGLQGDDFNSGAFLRAPDGTLYFGGNNGFNRFTPASLIATTNAFDPPVKLTGVSILNEPQLFEQPVERIEQLTLKHSDYVVGFEFAALDFTNPSANQYEYRLAKLETSWNQVGNLNRANYTNLPRGNYRFEVRAANSDGVWSQNTLSLAVVVLPPPWLTWWAFAVYATLAFIVVLVMGRAIASRARRQSERAANERLKTYLHCLNEATDSVAIVQPDGMLAYQNRASRMMFGANEERFAPVFADPERSHQALTQVEQRGRWQTTLQEGVGDNTKFIELTMTGVDLEENDRAMIAIARDVTNQKR